MNRLLIPLFLLLAIPFNPAFAAEPVAGQSHPIGNSGWHWMLSDPTFYSIQLSDTQDNRTVYDISECMFCSGEEDNCDEDGVYPVNLPGNEPAVAVICHKGAHSQRVQVLAPQRDREQPIWSVTGAYWVKSQPLDNGLKVTYDRLSDDGTPSINTVLWPQSHSDE